MGHCIISGNSERTRVVGLLKITNQFYIGDLVECLYLSCIGCTVCREWICPSLSFFFTSHLPLSGLSSTCDCQDYYKTTGNLRFDSHSLASWSHLISYGPILENFGFLTQQHFWEALPFWFWGIKNKIGDFLFCVWLHLDSTRPAQFVLSKAILIFGMVTVSPSVAERPLSLHPYLSLLAAIFFFLSVHATNHSLFYPPCLLPSCCPLSQSPCSEQVYLSLSWWVYYSEVSP